ncbi:Mov34/MPN/PAD-1 family protein [Aureimonas psammosilenae]|uniref:Mov34/MPN/PAD-1 family protein n=1 Tax=Aureimonas psammosilenae TaxID=2495496 RepID=UPI0012607E49|nr:Mov34/MPN/PAD-1 family protein [Aureimonas psammosilenae]
MELLLPETLANRMRRALRKAGRREIGGLLMAEHLSARRFRLVDLTIQTAGGTRASFERDPRRHQADLDAFFERTGKDFRRFNYIGEWHSHPCFEVSPSAKDLATMAAIVRDPDVGVNFAVLIIVRLDGRGSLAMSATAVLGDSTARPVSVFVELGAHGGRSSPWRRLLGFLTS